MEDFSGEGSFVSTPELISGDNAPAATPVYVSASGKGPPSSRRRASLRPSLDADELMNLLHGSDPVKLELNRLENEVRGQSLQLDPLCVNVLRRRFSAFVVIYAVS